MAWIGFEHLLLGLMDLTLHKHAVSTLISLYIVITKYVCSFSEYCHFVYSNVQPVCLSGYYAV